jgi:hypothetical protein
MHARGAGTAELLGAVRANPALLITDPTKDLRAFRVAITTPAGTKRGRGRGGFIGSVLDAIDGCYGEVLQHLKGWTAAPPRLREPADTPAETPVALTSTALSSQDGTEPVTATAAAPTTAAEEAPTLAADPVE